MRLLMAPTSDWQLTNARIRSTVYLTAPVQGAA